MQAAEKDELSLEIDEEDVGEPEHEGDDTYEGFIDLKNAWLQSDLVCSFEDALVDRSSASQVHFVDPLSGTQGTDTPSEDI